MVIGNICGNGEHTETVQYLEEIQLFPSNVQDFFRTEANPTTIWGGYSRRRVRGSCWEEQRIATKYMAHRCVGSLNEYSAVLRR